MLLAVVEKKLGYSFAGEDIYLNVAGGVTIEEPAADLGVVLAVVSCLKNTPAAPGHGRLRRGRPERRDPLRRPGRWPGSRRPHALGFETVVLPQGNLAALDKEGPAGDPSCSAARTVREAVDLRFLI